MANLDKPRGFQPAKTATGSPWMGLIRSIGANDGTDIFMYDSILTTGGLAVACSGDAEIVFGVAVGFGVNKTVAGTMGNSVNGMPFNPSNLDTGSRYYDDSASIHTEWNVFYVPAVGVLFSAQADGAESAALLRGSSYDTEYTAGDTTTGISGYEIKGGTLAGDNEGVRVVDYGTDPENDITADFANYLVSFNRTQGDDLV